MIFFFKTIGAICDVLIPMLFIINLSIYFFIISYLKHKNVVLKFKAFSITLILKEYKKLAINMHDNSIYIYYLFIHLNVLLAIVFFIGMSSAIVHDILAGNLF